jgi:hypothetical protein
MLNDKIREKHMDFFKKKKNYLAKIKLEHFDRNFQDELRF